ncbi:MAG: flagellum-specific ATP synthase FliI, partial [Hyphomicrobium aestuarii]|nr:flagellum-specific ATP synthase FliI [Hyphomicrobium aestuarii]
MSEVTSSCIKVSALADTAKLGCLVEVEAGQQPILGEVIAIHSTGTTIKLFSAAPRLGLGSRVWVRDELRIRPHRSWIGRVVNALGEPIDGKSSLTQGLKSYQIDCAPLEPMQLDRVQRPRRTGVRALDLF